MRDVYYKDQFWRHLKLALPLGLAMLISGCNTTSDIDTTLGSVTPTAPQAVLPPPSRPENVEIATQESAPTPTIVTQPAPVIEPQQAEEIAASETPTGPVDDLVPNLTIRNTGTFPNINDERQPSLRQFTPEEQASLSAYMNELAALHQEGQLSTAQYERRLTYLQNLARNHSRDALRQIGAL